MKGRSQARAAGRRQTAWAYLFLAPAFVLFAVTVFYPMIRAFQFSLYRWPLGSAPKEFIGLANYQRLLGRRSVP